MLQVGERGRAEGDSASAALPMLAVWITASVDPCTEAPASAHHGQQDLPHSGMLVMHWGSRRSPWFCVFHTAVSLPRCVI